MANEICDGCTARAAASADKDHMQLFFCMHHMNRMKVQLLEDGWSVSIHHPDLD